MRAQTQPPLADRMRLLAGQYPKRRGELLALADSFEKASKAFCTTQDTTDTQEVTERFTAAWRAAHKAYHDALDEKDHT